MNNPIDNIKWLDANELNGNDYNPNVVFTPELKLLETSILKTGWVQPILISKDKTIIPKAAGMAIVRANPRALFCVNEAFVKSFIL